MGTYRYLEFFQARSDWVLPGFGALDFYHDSCREFCLGAGRTLYTSKVVTWLEELYFAQATRSLAQRARYLWPWTIVDVRFTSRLTGEVVYFPYVPVNHSAHFRHVLKRAKVEYAPSKAWKVGGGMGRINTVANRGRTNRLSRRRSPPTWDRSNSGSRRCRAGHRCSCAISSSGISAGMTGHRRPA